MEEYICWHRFDNSPTKLIVDVDTILIRSEKEDQKANRVYNYRVLSPYHIGHN